jgi:S-adenosylmethionine:tRNA ribosyltransferase-isomerase
MLLEELSYELPESLIAAYPVDDRSSARLLVVDREAGELIHSDFASLGRFLSAGDLLVLNDSRVIPARLEGRKESGGRVAVLLVEAFDPQKRCWIALVDGSKKPRLGSRIDFTDEISATVVGDLGLGRFGLEFNCKAPFGEVLETLGDTPLPGYIHRTRPVNRADRELYQTVYSKTPGSVAAPTAGLHFTHALLGELEGQGIDTAYVTLHVGPGTFRPVRESVVERHRMEGEWYTINASTVAKIRRAKEEGRKVVAVGSTSTRTLEGVARRRGRIEADSGITRLFITEGYSFRVIDSLITNFHLPRSTPLAMVAAFAGMDLLRRAYAEAIERKYRFYSYGDAMLIL